MQITKTTLAEVTNSNGGIVLLGAGAPLQEWIDGVAEIFVDEGIAADADIWDVAQELTTTGGRTDLLLGFKEGVALDVGKMAMWRLRFGDCSWIEDYVVNYVDQHEVEVEA